jgi:lipid-A-disaccharide synthase
VVAIAAGESSGDQLGAALLEALRARRPDLRFIGIAGPGLRAAGCEPWHDTAELSVMGLVEVLRHLPRLARLRRQWLRRLLALRPAVYVGVDAPDFNLGIERALRQAGLRTVHYVCPSVWAWRSGRVATLRAACDRVLCLLPFEQPYLERAGVPGTFVGHPFADQIAAHPDLEAARAALQLAEGGPVLGILPGSRAEEVERLGPAFLGAAQLLAAEFPGLRCVAPMASARLRQAFAAQAAAAGVPVQLVDGRPREVMAASDVVLLASGTATLETMLVGRPMVVAYRFAPLTYGIARSLRLVKAAHMALPNLLAGERLVPEFLQHQVKSADLAAALAGWLRNPQRVAAVRARFSKLHEELRRNASACAAEAVLEVAGLAPGARPADRSL